MVDAGHIAKYLKRYIETYRQEYGRFTAQPPAGGGYPALPISPYLNSPRIYCYMANDGIAIADHSWEPPYDWSVVGGPALMVDFPETRTPPEVIELLKREGIWGEPIGIYRIVAKDGILDDVWQGLLGEPIEVAQESIGGTDIVIHHYNLDWIALVQRLTFGAFCLILDVHLGTADSDFWTPHIVRNIGFFTTDRLRKRFFHYLELLPHLDEAAWDGRSIAIRVQSDVRRDLASVFAAGVGGGTLSFGRLNAWVEHFHDRLSGLCEAIERFRSLLYGNPDGEEEVFHSFLKAYPILLDVYGEAISKPRFVYPPGESPLGKEYVEPDFVIRYPEHSYRLVELERPSKLIATTAGQTRSEVAQAAFQIAEWKAYIRNHYDVLKSSFPGIAVNHSTMIVISRSSQRSFGAGREINKYKELIREQYAVDDIFTYDDLLARAEKAYLQLSSLSLNA